MDYEMDYKFILTAWDGKDVVSVDADDDNEKLSDAVINELLKEAEQALETKATGWKLVRTKRYYDDDEIVLQEVVLQTEGEDEE